MPRIAAILFAGFLVSMHLAVLAHELGHALGILFGGGRVERIEMLTPLPAGFVRGNTPVPWLQTWGGVLFGVLATAIPLAITRTSEHRPFLRFLALMTAAFCLGHNGVYLFVGGLIPFADASTIAALGTPRWLLVLLGAALLIGFAAALRRAIQPLRGTLSRPQWLAAVEIGLLAIPALMLTFLLASGRDAEMRAPMTGLVSAYALCFALAASGREPKGCQQSSESTGPWLRWSFAAAAVVLALEWVLFGRW